jgi:hypothetical protein
VPAALNQRSGGKQNGVGAWLGSLMQRWKGGGPVMGCAMRQGWGGPPASHRGGQHQPESTGRGRPSKIGDTEVAIWWDPGNSVGAGRSNLFQIEIQTSFKSNSSHFKIWPT